MRSRQPDGRTEGPRVGQRPINRPERKLARGMRRHGHAMGTVPIWKQWLIIEAIALVSPVIVFLLACAFGGLLFHRLWPRREKGLGQCQIGGQPSPMCGRKRRLGQLRGG